MTFCEKIPSQLEIVPEFINKFLQSIKSFNINEEEIFQCKLALSEAVINAIKYGNKFNSSLPVEIDAEVSGARISITVRDHGPGFDYANLSDPTKEENLEKGSGRGVYLIRKLMDEVAFLDGGRAIKMTKFLKGGKTQ